MGKKANHDDGAAPVAAWDSLYKVARFHMTAARMTDFCLAR